MSALTVSLLSGRGVSTKSRTSNDSSSSVSMRMHYQRRSSLHHPTTTKNHHPRATPDRNWIKNNNKNSANNIQKSSKVRLNSPSFGGSSVLEDFDGQKPEIATTTRRSSTVNNPLRESKSRAENAMRARQFFNNKQSSSYANGGSAAFGSMVPEDEEASTSGQQELQQQQQQQQLEKQEREEQMSDIKKRMMVALECERQDLADGSVLFSFSEKPLTRQQKAALAAEEEKLQITSSDFERQPNFIERWFMTVRFQAATVSVEKAFFFVLSTPFRMVFWTFAYAMRLLFWIVTGRFSNLLFSLNKGKRRASKQLAANYSQMEIEKQRKEKMERERAFVEGSAKVARERLQL